MLLKYVLPILSLVGSLVGLFVEKDLIFQLDTRNFPAQAYTTKHSHNAALTDLEDNRTQFSFYERLEDKQAVSENI
jgi:hypothetical protein